MDEVNDASWYTQLGFEPQREEEMLMHGRKTAAVGRPLRSSKKTAVVCQQANTYSSETDVLSSSKRTSVL
jgi:hypothetical protein